MKTFFVQDVDTSGGAREEGHQNLRQMDPSRCVRGWQEQVRQVLDSPGKRARLQRTD